MSNFHASSAGIRALIGHPIHPDAASVLRKLGGKPSNFSARQISPKIVSDADLVLTMTRPHRDTVLELAPRQLHRTFTLDGAARLVSEFNARKVDDLAALRSKLPAGKVLDIPDPIGRSLDFHEKVGSQIAALLPPILQLCQRTDNCD